jgi:hypothetical protein
MNESPTNPLTRGRFSVVIDNGIIGVKPDGLGIVEGADTSFKVRFFIL